MIAFVGGLAKRETGNGFFPRSHAKGREEHLLSTEEHGGARRTGNGEQQFLVGSFEFLVNCGRRTAFCPRRARRGAENGELLSPRSYAKGREEYLCPRRNTENGKRQFLVVSFEFLANCGGDCVNQDFLNFGGFSGWRAAASTWIRMEGVAAAGSRKSKSAGGRNPRRSCST